MDYEQLEAEAHKLGGSGATYGYPKISDAALRLELSLREEERDSELLGAFVGELISELSAAIGDAPARTAPKSPSLSEYAPDTRQGRAHYQPLVLLAEDDPDMQRFVARLLRSIALVHVAGTGAEALAAVQTHRYDLILLDLRLPDQSGEQVLANLSRYAGDITPRVMMLTAARDREQVARLLHAGAKDYVVKPFQPPDFVRRVQTLLSLAPKIVLVADDDPLIRYVLRNQLERRGITVLQATNGVEALSFARKLRPHAMILDCNMPRMDGLTVLEELRADPLSHDTPVIVLSARRSEQDISEGYRCGATDYFTKPFRPDDILQRCVDFLPAA
jgi:DNA-binding response OmpR family regulator